ncbi:MAG: aminoglycoside phosphotransferase family protein, partial [Mangrovicoccus sp.]
MLNTPRDTELQQFIAASGWGAAEIASLAGDASNRRYSRLHHPKLGRAVLMDAPPNRGEDVRPFLKVTEILTQAGLSAPRILAQDTEIGALLIEDLGDAIYARVIENDASLERPLYEAAIDVLLHLHQRPIPEGLPDYTGARMAEASALAAIWYAGQGDSDHPFTAELQALMDQTLAQLPQTDLAMAQRDYHAENLLWLPQRQGPARVGLLD